jgi:hypothetical protein
MLIFQSQFIGTSKFIHTPATYVEFDGIRTKMLYDEMEKRRKYASFSVQII